MACELAALARAANLHRDSKAGEAKSTQSLRIYLRAPRAHPTTTHGLERTGRAYIVTGGGAGCADPGARVCKELLLQQQRRTGGCIGEGPRKHSACDMQVHPIPGNEPARRLGQRFELVGCNPTLLRWARGFRWTAQALQELRGENPLGGQGLTSEQATLVPVGPTEVVRRQCVHHLGVVLAALRRCVGDVANERVCWRQGSRNCMYSSKRARFPSANVSSNANCWPSPATA